MGTGESLGGAMGCVPEADGAIYTMSLKPVTKSRGLLFWNSTGHAEIIADCPLDRSSSSKWASTEYKGEVHGAKLTPLLEFLGNTNQRLDRNRQ